MSQVSKTVKKPKNVRAWNRERISPFCFGIKTKAGNPAHCNKNDDIAYHFACLKSGWPGRRLSKLRNSDMAEHFSGKKTSYFTSDGRSSIGEVLINIDIDCHGSVTLAGAVAFVEHLKATRFPDLYYEASTNGNGVHGYIIVAKGDLGDEGLNGALTVLDRWLKAELAKGLWDVENVEVKGQAPEFTRGQHKYELKSYKSGQLAKLPREVLTRADELRGATRVTVGELRKLPVPAARSELEASVVHRAGRAAKKTSAVSVPESENWEEPSVVSVKTGKTRSGSIIGRHFDDEELAKLGTDYLSLAKDLLGETKLVATGRKVVTEEDLAVFLMILRFFSLNMNADGSMPVARWKEMWTALHGAGDIGRAWCHHRFASIRNFLTSDGWLSWQDESFVVGVYDQDGRFVPGKASKWKGGDELMARLEEAVQEVLVPQAVDFEEKEDEKNTLYGNTQLDHDTGHAEIERYAPLEARETVNEPPPAPGARQSASFLDVLDSLGIWIPLQKPRFSGLHRATTDGGVRGPLSKT